MRNQPEVCCLADCTSNSRLLVKNRIGISESHTRVKRLKQVLYLVGKLHHLPTLVSKALQLKSERLCVLAAGSTGEGQCGVNDG